MKFRVFLLSPARCAGKRADLIFNDRAVFDLAVRLRQSAGVPVGEVFSFLSGLYFRGKLAYASAFARPPRGIPGALVITSDRGLISVDQAVTLADLRGFGAVPVDIDEPRYAAPLKRDAERLVQGLAGLSQVILLGSIATRKYCDPLVDVFGDRLHFPAEFAGRGDMSRGGLLLRCVDEQRELNYVKVSGGARHGSRPERLPKRR